MIFLHKTQRETKPISPDSEYNKKFWETQKKTIKHACGIAKVHSPNKTKIEFNGFFLDWIGENELNHPFSLR